MKRALFVSAVLFAAIAALLGAVVIAATDPFSSDSKPPQHARDPKGTPIPAQLGEPTPGEDWIAVPPESRTDIDMIDIVDAELFLPGRSDAANCEEGDLDPAKATAVIKAWLTENKSDLPHQQVWDQTLIGVTCSYPNDEFPGRVILYIGIPYVGHSFVAPASCQEKVDGLVPSASLPAECIPPDESVPPIEMASYTIVVNPEEVVK